MKMSGPNASAPDGVRHDLLFEINCEELPATNLADIFESKENFLLARLQKSLEDYRLVSGECRVRATSRRLVFEVRNLAAGQTAQEHRAKGPSRRDAYDENGQPTQKLQGFLKAKKASLENVEISEVQGKEYVFVKFAEPVRTTAEVLPELLDGFVRSLSFPKNMRWDDSGLYFPRPIRRFLCFYGDRPLSFKIGRLTAGRETSFFSRGKRKVVKVKDPRAYFRLLKKENILVDPAERRAEIRRILEDLAQRSKGRVYDDPFLLNEVTFLVENPQGIAARFDPQFLKLPLEVLTVSMARQQRIFGMIDEKGAVLPRFLAILDGRAGFGDKKAIAVNVEHVLEAKLKDSLFFFTEDTRQPLEKKRPELKGLIFLKNAGSMLEKSDRLKVLSGKLSQTLGLPAEEREALQRACELCKCDLLTHMVGEFPELQGIMGKYYALANGESPSAAEAVGEQYLPRTISDRLPETVPGSLLSVLDKCDLITACFALGMEPSSSADPYGLRRSATGAVKIILEKNLGFSLMSLLSENIEALGIYAPQQNRGKLIQKLELFFKDRFKAHLADRGYREDLIEAVTASNFWDLAGACRRLEALSRIFADKAFQEAWKVVERTANILRGHKDALPERVDASLFREDLERRVFASYEASQSSIRQATEGEDYTLATSLYAGAFFDILGEFFEKVFVNTDEVAVKKNRLTLLRTIKDLYTEKIADLSKIHLV